MLVLSRRVNEKIIIGEGETAAVIEVKSIHRGYVQIGIDARRDIPIHRAELLERPPVAEAACGMNTDDPIHGVLARLTLDEIRRRLADLEAEREALATLAKALEKRDRKKARLDSLTASPSQ